MVAQEILDLLVWVRALVPEPFFYLKTGTTAEAVVFFFPKAKKLLAFSFGYAIIIK